MDFSGDGKSSGKDFHQVRFLKETSGNFLPECFSALRAVIVFVFLLARLVQFLSVFRNKVLNYLYS